MRPVPDKILKERVETMLALAFEKRKIFFEKSVSKKFTLLVENLNGVLSGTTENYINCVVKGYNSVNAKEGDFLPVIIKSLEVDEKKRKILASCEIAN
jgi:tRNA A37 methylthiotransferase MiaB